MSKEVSPKKLTKGQFNVRFAKVDDVDFVQQDGYISQDIVLRKISDKEVILSEKGKHPVGYLRIEYLWSRLPYIAIIRVSESCRRQGIGKAMLRFLTERLREQGYQVLYSSSQVNEADSQAWHRHMGFEECGILAGVNEGGVGEVFFRKVL